MYCINDIIKLSTKDDLNYYRVIYIDNIFKKTGLINQNSKELELKLVDNECLLDTVAIVTSEKSSENIYTNPNELNKYSERIEKVYEIIKFIYPEQNIDFFYFQERNQLINQASIKFNVSKRMVKLYLAQYFKGGMTKIALIPKYKNCGGRGKNRINCNHNSLKAIGRPKESEGDESMKTRNINESEVNLILKYYDNSKFNENSTYKSLYKKIIRENYMVKINGELVKDETVFTYEQFLYWIKKLIPPERLKRRHVGKIYYENNCKPVRHRTNEYTSGIGSSVEIDTTCSDIYVVSDINKCKVMGKPYISLAVDVFSRFIMGVIIAFEGENWNRTALLIRNMVEDKKSYCKKFGLDIEKDDWNCSYLAKSYLGDNGMIKDSISNKWISSLKINVSNTAPYYGRGKPNVEKTGDLVVEELKEHLNGHGAVFGKQKRGNKQPQSETQITYDTFRKILLEVILVKNNRRLENFNLTEEMLNDKVIPTPKSIWNWCLKNGNGDLSQIPINNLNILLLPERTGRIGDYGLTVVCKYGELNYHLEDRRFNYICNKAKFQKHSIKTKVLFDPNDIRYVYTYMEEDDMYAKWILDDPKCIFQNTCYKAVEEYFEEKRELEKQAERESENKLLNMQLTINEEIDESLKQVAEAQKFISKTELIKGIGENLKDQKDREKVENTFDNNKNYSDEEVSNNQQESQETNDSESEFLKLIEEERR